jgi:hypothetical protein
VIQLAATSLVGWLDAQCMTPLLAPSPPHAAQLSDGATRLGIPTHPTCMRHCVRGHGALPPLSRVRTYKNALIPSLPMPNYFQASLPFFSLCSEFHSPYFAVSTKPDCRLEKRGFPSWTKSLRYHQTIRLSAGGWRTWKASRANQPPALASSVPDPGVPCPSGASARALARTLVLAWLSNTGPCQCPWPNRRCCPRDCALAD